MELPLGALNTQKTLWRGTTWPKGMDKDKEVGSMVGWVWVWAWQERNRKEEGKKEMLAKESNLASVEKFKFALLPCGDS